MAESTKTKREVKGQSESSGAVIIKGMKQLRRDGIDVEVSVDGALRIHPSSYAAYVRPKTKERT